MIIDATLRKTKTHWLAEVPLLDLMTLGRSRREAIEMLSDAVSLLSGERAFSVKSLDAENSYSFMIESDDHDELISLILKRQRQKSGLTLREVSARLGEKSPNAFARYENGSVRPSIRKMFELLKAVDPDLRIGLRCFQ